MKRHVYLHNLESLALALAIQDKVGAMNVQEMIDFLILVRDKVDILIPKISINQSLVEISAMLTDKIEQLEGLLPPATA